RSATGRGRGGLAVQPSYFARTLYPQGSDPDRRKLERAVAWTGRDAESERIADQGVRHVQHAVERGFHRRVFPGGTARVAGGRGGEARFEPRASAGGFQAAAKAEELGAKLAGELKRGKAIMGVFDEGCMGMYNAIIPDEMLHTTGVF